MKIDKNNLHDDLERLYNNPRELIDGGWVSLSIMNHYNNSLKYRKLKNVLALSALIVLNGSIIYFAYLAGLTGSHDSGNSFSIFGLIVISVLFAPVSSIVILLHQLLLDQFEKDKKYEKIIVAHNQAVKSAIEIVDTRYK